MKNNIVLRPSYWASVSGGKDSLYMLKLILEHPDEEINGTYDFNKKGTNELWKII